MQFDFNLQANQNQHIDVSGTFLKYINGNGKIRVRLNGGGYIDLLPGQGVANVKFNNVDVQDRSGLMNAGTILAGTYDFRDDNVYGTVALRDNSQDLVTANKAFMANSFTAQVDATHPRVMFLMNPANSGKIVKIRTFRYSAPGGLPPSGFKVRIGVAFAIVGTDKAVSKFAGGASSTTVVSSEGVLETALTHPVLIDIKPTLASDKFELRDPIVLPPGMAFMVHNTATADTQTTYWSVEFTEE